MLASEKRHGVATAVAAGAAVVEEKGPHGELEESVKQRQRDELREHRAVGSPLRRVEDRRLITGNDRYIDNLKFPGLIYAGFVRSPYAHAKIKKIDTSKLESNPQVVSFITPEEARAKTAPIPVVWRVPYSKLHEHYALAQRTVNHVGDPVLCVAVRDKYALEDALESVSVEYEILDPVLDASSAEKALPIHEELGTNLCFAVPISAGNVDEALRSSSVVVSGTFKLSRVAASPMEARGVIANPVPESGAELTVYSSTQWPHILRTSLAGCLNIPENTLRVVAPDVGGAFGVKGEVFAEEIAVCLLALKCRRPVKWVESRRESFLATTHARDQVLKAEAGFSSDGILKGLKVESVCDFGAYLHTITMGSGFITAISFNGPYKFQNFSIVAKGVYTNKVSLSAYRGFGQPEAAFVFERLMSMGAKKLGMDPSEVRFRNLIAPTEMPYTTPTGGVIDSGDYASLFKKALDLAGYEEMVKRRELARREGKLRGVGISLYTETSGFAPGFVFAHLGLTIGGYDSATVRINPDGKVAATTGALPHGQGFNTTLAQICADELGLDFGDVLAYHGDTSSSPYGQGSFGSRTVAVAGSAAVLASRKLAEKVKRIGAHLMGIEVSPTVAADLILSEGSVVSRSLDKRVPIKEVARAAYRAHNLPPDVEPGLEATVYFNPVGLTTSYAAHISEVEVDRESGMIKLLKHVCVHDCGNEINPMIVEGQIHGAIAQAIGVSLLEEVAYDASGQLGSGSFMDYLLPTAEIIPPIVLSSTTVPTPINPLGAKGVGESGTIIAPPSIANAVSDAIAAEMNTLPMTPERVWAVIRERASKQ
ncbi:MAG TPA: xanthine dehydrogenase family protein molybdopterin-binding subunit [Nitrososphaerales archaeon]|nr:xanthine dehydrogenase family protein molybdopterin-binding subunit [Nitrososphaerales archaeon]